MKWADEKKQQEIENKQKERQTQDSEIETDGQRVIQIQTEKQTGKI